MIDKATLRLFNAIQVEERVDNAFCDTRTLQNGYIVVGFSPTTIQLDTIENIIGISGEKANQAFHKSWSVVRDSDIETLVMQQILHYITTYDFEFLGIYDKDTVYIPHEKLEVPRVTADIPLTVVRGLTASEILAKIIELSSIALHQDTLDDIMTVVVANGYDASFVKLIRNRELKALLYDHYEIVPSEPVEYLRYLVVNLTDESLLIKNKNLIDKLKASNHRLLDRILKDAPSDLASIFYRYKPLFLAMKTASHNKNFFNRLRKQAKKIHEPLPEDYLNSVTEYIANENLDWYTLQTNLDKVNTFRKIRLANALRFRLSGSHSILYRVRNGRGWVTNFEWNGKRPLTAMALNVVLVSIANDLREKVEGQTFYIPKYIHYTLPATEKQFVSNLPNGTYVSVPNDMIFGIYWENTDRRIDLDLAVISQSGKIGWDVSYRSKNRDVLFSGDVTDATNGASELFYIKRQANDARLVTVNYYNHVSNDPVPTKIIVASEKPNVFDKDYMIDVNTMLANANIEIASRQNIVGLVANSNFYFTNVSVGNSVTSSNNQQAVQTREYLIASLTSAIELQNILEMAGAIVVDEQVEDCVDLSPGTIDKTTIINLLT